MKSKVKSSIMIDGEVWKGIKIEAIRQDMEVGEFIENTFREIINKR